MLRTSYFTVYFYCHLVVNNFIIFEYFQKLYKILFAVSSRPYKITKHSKSLPRFLPRKQARIVSIESNYLLLRGSPYLFPPNNIYHVTQNLVSGRISRAFRNRGSFWDRHSLWDRRIPQQRSAPFTPRRVSQTHKETFRITSATVEM